MRLVAKQSVIDLANSRHVRPRHNSPMACPSCGGRDTICLDTRPCRSNSSIRRRRGCRTCNWRWTTHETSGRALDDFIHLFAFVRDEDKETLLALTRRLSRARS